MKGRSLKILTFVAIVVLALGISVAASAAPDTKPLLDQETCPSGGDWVKVEGLSGTSFTYTAPEGKVIVAWCYKASTSVISGVVDPPQTSYTVISTVGHDLSHASFQLADAPRQPATVSVAPGACVWDGESLTPVTVAITGDATVTITGPGGPYVYTSSGSFNAAPGSYSWTAVAGDGYYIDGPSTGSFVAESCIPDDDPATVGVEVGACVWDGESSTPVTVVITGDATLTITGPGGPYVFTASGSFDAAPGSYSWTAVAGDGYYIDGPSTGSFVAESCEPEDEPATVNVAVCGCVWDDGQSLTFVSVNITGDATLTITGPGGPHVFTASGSFNATPGIYNWTAVAGTGYYIEGPDSGSFEALSCAPDEASVQIAIGICVYEEGDSTTEVTVTINGNATVTIEGPGGPYVYTNPGGSFNGAPGSYSWAVVVDEGYVLVGEASGEFSLVSCEPKPKPTPTPKEPPTGAFDSPNLLPGLLAIALGSALVLFGRRKKMI